MAASVSTSVSEADLGAAADHRESEVEPECVPEKRDPAVGLWSAVSGLQPLCWSADHRLSVCTQNSLALMELICDVSSSKPELTLHRTSIPVPEDQHQLRVGSSAAFTKATEKFSLHPDPTIRQNFLADKVMNPTLGARRGMKYSCWSPLGCDSAGRCLLASLTLDHRLSVYTSHGHLQWNAVTDVTRMYGTRLKERGYARKDDAPPQASLLDLEELRRRFRMQTPLSMKWSKVYTIKQVQEDNSVLDEDMVLLAVLMENGDLVLWKFSLPVTNESDVVFYDIMESGVDRPSDVAWWEYENAERRMSGLIVGSQDGPVKIIPVSLTGVKGYSTLRHPVILWKESDHMAVENLRCVAMFHPLHRCSCSLIVASRGCYVFWCLLVISSAGLNVHNSHIAGVHSLPILSMAVSPCGATVYTCSMDGTVKKLTPTFSESTLVFKQEDMKQPENIAGRRIHGIAVSSSGAYMALVTTQGMVANQHPVTRTYQVQFITLTTPETAATLLLNSTSQNLFRNADLLDLVRWKVLTNGNIPPSLLQQLDLRVQEVDSLYFWRFKLSLMRILYKSLQTSLNDQSLSVKYINSKVLIQDKDGEEEKWAEPEAEKDERSEEDKKAEVEAQIKALETHLMRENMKKVLGVVYLNTWITPNISIPSCGLMDFLSRDANDRAAENKEVQTLIHRPCSRDTEVDGC
ncbi:general transcription factor 3C polypeptide 4 isoform X2 [Gouania willdenowi]|uniref:general transcription factor 3C polypeptide 4 isoform X2 n=1 Tax=Gouania willdenowi TaxID=441366 RepID=UPI001056CAC5|nr:general transcription factor 3C polypeptide 4 isoform X2 [Gouania willdenowi]